MFTGLKCTSGNRFRLEKPGKGLLNVGCGERGSVQFSEVSIQTGVPSGCRLTLLKREKCDEVIDSIQ